MGMPIIKMTMVARYEGIAALRRRPIKFRRLNVDFKAVYRLTGLPSCGHARARQLKCGTDVTTRNIAAFHRSVCRRDSYRQFARTRTIAAKYNNYNGLAVIVSRSLSFVPSRFFHHECALTRQWRTKNRPSVYHRTDEALSQEDVHRQN